MCEERVRYDGVEQVRVVNALRLASWLTRFVTQTVCSLSLRRAACVQWANLRYTASLSEALPVLPYYHLILYQHLQLVEMLCSPEHLTDSPAYKPSYDFFSRGFIHVAGRL